MWRNAFLQPWKHGYRWKDLEFILVVTARKRWLASKQFATHKTFHLSHLILFLSFFCNHSTSSLQTPLPNAVAWSLSQMLYEIRFCEPDVCSKAQACFSKNTLLLFRCLIFIVELFLVSSLRIRGSPTTDEQFSSFSQKNCTRWHRFAV